jgi:hypothetical protein
MPHVPPALFRWAPEEPFNPALAERWAPLDLTGLSDLPACAAWHNDWTRSTVWNHWQKFPGDLGWQIEHSFGFLGQICLLATTWEGKMFFKAGGRYFIWDAGEQELEEGLKTFDGGSNVDPLNILRDEYINAHWLGNLNQAAELEAQVFEEMWAGENRRGRNRWVEQQGRGGRPHESLLRMPCGNVMEA